MAYNHADNHTRNSTQLQNTTDNVRSMLTLIMTKLDLLDSKFDSMHKKIDSVQKQLEEIQGKLDTFIDQENCGCEGNCNGVATYISIVVFITTAIAICGNAIMSWWPQIYPALSMQFAILCIAFVTLVVLAWPVDVQSTHQQEN
ncbi:hypothetical protein MP228_008975 [Amoeboaphelidium protococcarum]|nr:hypothetical protein MP228_008975 [Amoeboaphelidium protococcarum]